MKNHLRSHQTNFSCITCENQTGMKKMINCRRLSLFSRHSLHSPSLQWHTISHAALVIYSSVQLLTNSHFTEGYFKVNLNLGHRHLIAHWCNLLGCFTAKLCPQSHCVETSAHISMETDTTVTIHGQAFTAFLQVNTDMAP